MCAYNVLKRLAVKNTIYLLAFSESTNDRPMPGELENVFSGIYTVELRMEKRSQLRYVKNLLSWNSGLQMKHRYPEDYFRFKKEMTNLIISKKIDMIHCHLLQMAEFAFDAKTCVRVLHLIDSETLRIKREIAIKNPWERLRDIRKMVYYYRIKSYEKIAMDNFDLSITVGKKDFTVLKRLSPNADIALISNGVDIDYFYPWTEVPSDYPILIFFGNMNFRPNIDAITYFCHAVFPIVRKKIPDIHLYIVGANPTEQIRRLAKEKNIVVTGYVDDIRNYIAKADIVICPMRIGGGIKNKNLEAMSSGRVVISTSIGVEGLEVSHGKNILIANTPDEFAENIESVLNDRALRNNIINNARELIREHYTWNISFEKYERLYENLLRNKRLNMHPSMNN